mmetsp:Transcript_9342/g.29122  ORF Transcript_9342/g.29122 Transcript_9342/m.29122 type:complete len:301 (-) Transcript_9342:7-909(-)
MRPHPGRPCRLSEHSLGGRHVRLELEVKEVQHGGVRERPGQLHEFFDEVVELDAAVVHEAGVELVDERVQHLGRRRGHARPEVAAVVRGEDRRVEVRELGVPLPRRPRFAAVRRHDERVVALAGAVLDVVADGHRHAPRLDRREPLDRPLLDLGHVLAAERQRVIEARGFRRDARAADARGDGKGHGVRFRQQDARGAAVDDDLALRAHVQREVAREHVVLEVDRRQELAPALLRVVVRHEPHARYARRRPVHHACHFGLCVVGAVSPQAFCARRALLRAWRTCAIVPDFGASACWEGRF